LSKQMQKKGLGGLGLFVFGSVALLPGRPILAALSQPLYWLEQGTTNAIKRSSIDGTNVQAVISGQGFITSFTVDRVGSRIYWTTADAINSSAIDGSDVRSLVTGLSVPGSGTGHNGIAVDAAHQEIYFTSLVTNGPLETGAVNRIGLDGQNLATLATTPANPGDNTVPSGIAVDPAGGKIYWSDRAIPGLHVANLDGSNDHLVNSNYGVGVAFSPALKKVFMTDTQANIERLNADGSGDVLLLDLYDAVSPAGLAIDDTSKKVLVADSALGSIDVFSIPPSGIVFAGGASTRLITGLDHPSQVVLIPEPASLTLLSASFLLLRRSRSVR
jgi:DNA-binding beta-propeller fold protein YncE